MTIKYIITTTSGHVVSDEATGVDSWPTHDEACAALADMDARGVLDEDTYQVLARAGVAG